MNEWMNARIVKIEKYHCQNWQEGVSKYMVCILLLKNELAYFFLIISVAKNWIQKFCLIITILELITIFLKYKICYLLWFIIVGIHHTTRRYAQCQQKVLNIF